MSERPLPASAVHEEATIRPGTPLRASARWRQSLRLTSQDPSRAKAFRHPALLLGAIWLLGMVALGAVVQFQSRVDDTRRAQVVIAQMRNQQGALLAIAFDPAVAATTSAPGPAQTAVRLTAAKKVLTGSVAELERLGNSDAAGRIGALSQDYFTFIDRLSALVAVGNSQEAALQLGRSQQPGGLESRMAVEFERADAGYGNDASRSKDVASIGTILAIVSLLAAFSFAYVHAARGRQRSRRDATTDALTGLGNRRKLFADMADRGGVQQHAEPVSIGIFDLDGFKAYNDTFGHPAGDALLARAASRLAAAVAGRGDAYRIGGDEFVVIAAPGHGEGLLMAAQLALTDEGPGFSIGCSRGSTRILVGDTLEAALHDADQRLYANKRSRRTDAGTEARDTLLQVLAEQDEALVQHLKHVAALAASTASDLGLPRRQIELTRLAAELHDVGKLAIPAAILDKPGKLTPTEFAFIQRHSVIGERIVAAAPALESIAPIVRAAHERVDGSGYPDGLMQDEIPICARVIAVVDAFDAMTSDRAYRTAMPDALALAELHRNAGTQFDPQVVAAFDRALARRNDGAGSSPIEVHDAEPGHREEAASSAHPLRSAIRRTAIGLVVVVAAIAATVPAAMAAATPMVDLGTASSYAAISGASIGNTVSAVGAPHTTLRGDLGVAVATQPTGFPPGVVTGATNIGNAAAVQAHVDLVAAYAAIVARPGGAAQAGALAGATITPGLYTIGGAASNTGTLTLDAGGDPNAVFVFQVNGALAFAAGSHVTLTGGAQASRIFWQVNGAGAIGAGSSFAGTMIAMDAVAIGNGSLFNGRAFARNGALTMDASEFYSSPPVVTITGGATAYTTTMNPTISGTTDVVAPALVTVTVNNQTLTATPSAGTWSVTPALLANDVYPVTATVVDGADNVGTAAQLLTVDTVLPVVTLDGGGTVATNDATPTISGTTDVPAGTLVQVGVDASNLVALVQTGGWWNVTPAPLLDGPHVVAVSVDDAAGNEGVDTQLLSVDTTAPAVTITGGATALSNDPTPLLTGTAAIAAGMTVTVDLADETLTAVVGADGSWSATAAALADGAHRIVLTTADAAGNGATVTQWLTIDTVAPAMTITGGATSTTIALTPTITGTSGAAAASTVTVTVAGQTMTTLVQGSGTWNVTPGLVGLGTWPVVASAPDPAGNIGTATQALTIATPPITGTEPPPPPPIIGTGTPPTTGSATLNVRAATAGTKLLATVHWSRPVTVTYRWFRDGALISGGTTPTHTVSAADLGHQLWLVAWGADAGRSVVVTTPRITPRASSTLTLKASSTRVRTGKVVILRGALRSAALPARRTVRVTLRQRVGKRWVLRRSVSVRTTSAGAFAFSYRVPAGRRGAWRAQALFAGVAAQRPAISPFAAFTAR